MESTSSTSSSLFQVFLRLKPRIPPLPSSDAPYPELPATDRFLTVEPSHSDDGESLPTHIIVTPPTDSKRRAVEKFAFTTIFQESATQLDLFHGTGVVQVVKGVLGLDGRSGRDGLMATLGVTGSGKSHTTLGSPSQRGLTQLALDVLFRSLGDRLSHPDTALSLLPTLAAADASDANLIPASAFLDGLFRDSSMERMTSRAQTPMMVGNNALGHPSSMGLYSSLLGLRTNGNSPRSVKKNPQPWSPFFALHSARVTRSTTKLNAHQIKDVGSAPSHYHRRQILQRLSALPRLPDVSDITISCDEEADYAVLVSMYEVYNDRIFDLLAGPPSLKDLRRRPLLFKSTEQSPDRKLVAGLRKVICGTLDDALMILELGLMERRVAGTGSNSVSSRSHGFFCVEVNKRSNRAGSQWTPSTLTIVDLAGSERARNAKTAGATLAEAGKINESLMYLGQCLQMQSDNHDKLKPAAVPFRQCKLTELLFSNSFASTSATAHHHANHHRNPQRAIMIVTADPLGDFNATSQILRYSALAREITVPRIPSISSTILSGAAAKGHFLPSGRTTPASLVTAEELVAAAQEIARLTDEVEKANVRVIEEQNRRHEAELAWRAVQERCEVMEQEIRDDCWIEMEKVMEKERRRWKWAWEEEADRTDKRFDQTLDILARSMSNFPSNFPSHALPGNMLFSDELFGPTDQNAELGQDLQLTGEELVDRSPSKENTGNSARSKTAASSIHEQDINVLLAGLENLDLQKSSTTVGKPKTPGKKQRPLTSKKWEMPPEVPSP